MRIKSLPRYQRPREKLMYYGADALSDTELLSLMIRTGSTSKSAIELAEEVLAYADSEAGGLRCVTAEELTNIDGIGASKACSIVAGMELVKRCGSNPVNERIRIKSPADVADHLMESLRYEKKEHFITLLLNAKGEVEAKVPVSVGELSTAVVHPREVFKPAIRRSAASIIAVHNHPSGDPTASAEDINTTIRLVEASKIIGINFLDHVIIGDGRYVSMREEGLFTP